MRAWEVQLWGLPAEPRAGVLFWFPQEHSSTASDTNAGHRPPPTYSLLIETLGLQSYRWVGSDTSQILHWILLDGFPGQTVLGF